MKRFLLLFAGVALALQFFAPAVSANTQNFTINKYEADYYLSKDADKRSTLKVIEKITATFPESNENHGLERAIPKKYDGHTTHLAVESVVSEAGKSYPYTTYTSHGNEVVRIGDKDKYVHGPMTYVLTYTQTDVTRYFDDTKSDEFYWDLNGTEWTVPITSYTANIHIDESIASVLKSEPACYIGVSGSKTPCEVTRTGNVYTVSETNLFNGVNVTVAFGFSPETFAAYTPTKTDIVQMIFVALLVLTSIIGVVVIILLSVRYYRKSDRRNELKPIAPEYIPPKDASVTVSASISSTVLTAGTAQIIDFAVRHYIKIYETKQKGFLKSADYELEIVRDIRDLNAEEQEILGDLFGNTDIGSKVKLSTLQNNAVVAKRLQDNQKKLTALVRGEYGMREKRPEQSRWFRNAGIVLIVVGVLTLGPVLFLAGIVSLIMGITLWPLTDKGVALMRYLEGLKMYIKAAEADRLKMLQSPDGAQKVQVSAEDPAQLVKLYERVLPYAVLFGLEKQWNERIGKYYESIGQTPEWFESHNGVFNAVLFSSAMSSFVSTSNYSSVISSSAGGSSGGGSSGGGGGGGGGGGW